MESNNIINKTKHWFPTNFSATIATKIVAQIITKIATKITTRNKVKIPTASMLQVLCKKFIFNNDDLSIRHKLMLKYGNVYRLGTHVIISDPEFAEYMLKTNCNNYTRDGQIWAHLEVILGYNSFTIEDDNVAYLRRKLVSQAYTNAYLTRYVQQVQDSVLPAAISNLKQTAQTKHNIALSVAIFNIPYLAIVNFLLQFQATPQQFKRAFKWFNFVNSKPLFLYKLKLPNYFCAQLKRRGLVKDIEYMITANTYNPDKEYKDLLFFLSEPKAELSARDIREELMGHILAGMITSGSAMCWTLYKIFTTPKVLARLRAEIAAFPNPTTFEELQQFEYCKAVVNEGLRLYPAVSFIPRTTIAADTFKNYKIPANTTVLLDLYSMHRHAGYWQDPETFNPERFLQKTPVANRYAFIPFSMGKRLCVGNQLAIIQQMLTIMAMVSNFDLSFPKSIIADSSGILNPPLDLICCCKVRTQ